MKVNSVRIGGVSVIAPEGRLDLAGADEFDRIVMDEVRNQVAYYVIDLKNLQYTQSAGLRVMLKLKKMLLDMGGEMRVVKPSAQVFELFQIGSMDTLFDFYPSLEAALKDWPAEKKK